MNILLFLLDDDDDDCLVFVRLTLILFWFELLWFSCFCCDLLWLWWINLLLVSLFRRELAIVLLLIRVCELDDFSSEPFDSTLDGLATHGLWVLRVSSFIIKLVLKHQKKEHHINWKNYRQFYILRW